MKRKYWDSANPVLNAVLSEYRAVFRLLDALILEHPVAL